MSKTLYNLFFNEDLPQGDITSLAIFGKDAPQKSKGFLIAKENLVLSGQDVVKDFLKLKFPRVKIRFLFKDGGAIPNKSKLAMISGPTTDLLACERSLLNILQRLTGVATYTSQFVQMTKGRKVAILDTRKTTPGWREWEKKAVRDGGAQNHRMNLSAAYMIKENHIAAAGSLVAAIQKIKDHKKRFKKTGFIEVEVETLTQLRQALLQSPDIILLDNMTVSKIKKAVQIRNQVNPEVLLEISGGVRLSSLKQYVTLGVDRISVGAITHSAPAADISMLLE